MEGWMVREGKEQRGAHTLPSTNMALVGRFLEDELPLEETISPSGAMATWERG